MLGLYNGIFDINYLAKSETHNETITNNVPNELEGENSELSMNESDEDITADLGLQKAIDHYRKIIESDHELSESEMSALDKTCEVIRNREIITNDVEHIAKELEDDTKILMGPPTLTRFEKARIMGARALQLSLGAPPFVDVPKNATTSLQIAMEELENRIIPITIRRVQPNGDYQNIPLPNFK